MNFLDYTGTSRLVNKILAKINALNTKLDNLTDQSSSGTPVGTISWFSGTAPPDGSAISKSLYNNLFSVIGTIFGTGNGSTTFNIPDLRGSFIRGAESSTYSGVTYSATFGEKQSGTYLRNDVKMIGNVGYNYVNIMQADSASTYSPSKYTVGNYTLTNSLAAIAGRTRPYNLALTPIIKY